MENKTTQGLGKKNVLPFPQHDSFKYWRLKSNVNSHMPIQYINQSESLSSTLMCPKANNVSKHQTHVTEQLYWQTCVTTEWYPFVKCWPGVGIY